MFPLRDASGQSAQPQQQEETRATGVSRAHRTRLLTPEEIPGEDGPLSEWTSGAHGGHHRWLSSHSALLLRLSIKLSKQ